MPLHLMYRHIVNQILHLLHRRLTHPRIIRLDGLHIQVCPHVFHPKYGRTTPFFIHHMIIRPDERVLEVGTGTGAIAAAAARSARAVVATDVNPYAVKCAHATRQLNKLEQRMTILEGDLFTPVKGEGFDVILFNPPYFDLVAKSWIGSAWAAGLECELITRFLGGARSCLKEGGRIQLLVSSAAPLRKILQQIQKAKYQWKIIAQGRLLGFLERLYLFQLW